jgi:hypothetical protein
MKEYEIVYEGTVREYYYVEAESAEQAREIWSEVDADTSEVIEGGVIEVNEVE